MMDKFSVELYATFVNRAKTEAAGECQGIKVVQYLSSVTIFFWNPKYNIKHWVTAFKEG